MATAPKMKNHGQVGVVHIRSEVQAGRMTEAEAEKLSHPSVITNAKAPSAAPKTAQPPAAPPPGGNGKQ